MSEDRLERVVRLYRQRAARCRTENQFNRLHITLANYMTPAEVRYFAAALADDSARSPVRQWFAALAKHLPRGQPRACEFVRHGLLKGASRYCAEGVRPAGKTLIIGFCGVFHRLMIPTPWLLDCLNPELYDVVVLRDYARNFYASGIPGLGADFASALEGLRRRVEPASYANAVALGTSGGGSAALLAAIALGLDKGIAVGAQDFASIGRKLAQRRCRDPYAELLASTPARLPSLTLAYAADNPADAAAATAIRSVLPAELRPVRHCANHAVLAWHHQRGTLRAYLAKLLDQGLESRELLAASGAVGLQLGSMPS